VKFSIDVFDHEVPALARRLFDLTGKRPWQRRFEWLERELSENEYMHPWLQQHCAIELAMKDALESGRLAAGRQFRIETIAHHALASFVCGVVRCHDQLSPKAQIRLVGMLLDGLKEDTGLLSLQHEFMTAVHLISRGFDVEFHDLEMGGGHDFTARQGAVEIEVECKMFSADLGRKFHKRSTAALSNRLHDLLTQTQANVVGGVLVVLTLPGRLSASLTQHQGIEQTLRTGLLAGELRTTSEHCSVEVRDFDMTLSPFNSSAGEVRRDKVDEFVARHTGRSNCPAILLFSPGTSALVLVLKSEKTDDVLDGMRRQLREGAKKQFSGVRPAYLAAQLQDLTAEQMGEMAHSDSSWRGNATGLQQMTSDFLYSSSASHIHSVVYRSHSTFAGERNGVTATDGLAYVIKNGLHPLARDQRYAVFGPDRSVPKVLGG
jgi:hypothetical protein